MQILGYILTAIFGVLVGGFIRIWNSYSDEKGKNFATKEDIAELTKVAKEIEARISDEVWDRQRQWEMKKEIYLDAAQMVARGDAKLAQAVASYFRREISKREIEECEELWYTLARHGSSIMIVSKKHTIDAFSSMNRAFVATITSLNPQLINHPTATERFDEFRSLVSAFYTSIRMELGIGFDESGK